MNTQKLAEQILKDLNEKGAGLGSVSRVIIKKTLDDYTPIFEKIEIALKVAENYFYEHTSLVPDNDDLKGYVLDYLKDELEEVPVEVINEYFNS